MMSDEGKEAEQDYLGLVNPIVIWHGKSSARNNNNRKYAVYFSEERHNDMVFDPSQRAKVAKWRMKDRMKTISVALVICLNLGVDPPDVIKTYPCARMETWLDPTQMQSSKALELIGKRIQEQYERWQARARYKQCLDPTVEEVKKLCLSIRRNAKDERVLFHYNGHGVPRPTSNGEIWVFNKGFTQYIPLSIYDLQTWVGSPSIYVFDCSSAGTILNWFNQFAEQREKELERMVSSTGGTNGTTPTQPLLRDCILLAACGTNEILPMSPEYPADMFTSCLTTPIKMALRWFCTHTILTGITMDMIDKIPGHLNSRRTPLGELNWIFTAVTDTIAWNILPRELFQKLFRQVATPQPTISYSSSSTSTSTSTSTTASLQRVTKLESKDLLVASLFRNFLLAERIMRGANCTPVSSPPLPPTYMHPMWQAWDLAVDICLSQFPAMLANPNLEFKHSPFFTEQLTAFEVWLESGNEHKPPPEQLPIVLQVLLSQVHRLRALVLLGRFLDLGPWAVNLALSVGIFPYVLKLLQSAAADLRQILIFIWAKILALDKACQLDLVKDNGHRYFIGVLTTPGVPPDQRAMATFVLTIIVNNCRPGQSACLNENLLSICLQQTNDPDPTVRRWMVICLSKLWENFEEAKNVAIRESAHVTLCAMLQDVEPEVRAAAVYGLGTFVGGAEGNEQRTNIELNIGITLPVLTADASPIVRRELVIALSHLVVEYDEKFKAVAHDFAHEEKLRALREQREDEERKKKETKGKTRKELMTSSEPIPPMPASFNSPQLSSVYGLLWKLIIELCSDPHPEVATLANEVARTVTVQIEQDSLVPILLHKRPSISTSAGMLKPSPKKLLSPAATLATIAKSKLGHQRNSSNTQAVSNNNNIPNSPSLSASSSSIISAVGDGGNVTLAGGTTNITSAIIHDYNGSTIGGAPGRKSTMDFGFSGGFGDDYLTSSYYEWGANFYARPLIVEEEDPNSPTAVDQRWRAQRNDRTLHESWELNDPSLNPKTDTQISILDNEAEEASVVLFHPFENTMVVAYNNDALSVWNWEAGHKLHVFSNSNPHPSCVTTLKFINEYERGLLLVGSNDGIIRMWQGIESADSLRLVSAWRALPEAPQSSNSSMVVEWQQDLGRLLVAGDVSFVRVWDAERELSVQDIPTECPVGVTSIASHGRVFATGCQDGSVRLFDMRVQNKYSNIATFTEHKSWTVGVAMPKVRDNMIVSCSATGEIKFWQAGYPNPTLGIANNEPTSALAVHDFAPVLACGSLSQKIKLINFSGEELSMIRYHDGFLGQRIGPVSCLAFHPYKMYLAAGATDSIVSIYTGESGRINQKQML